MRKTPPTGPYAGFQTRDIKSLSPAQLAQIRDGEGMGLALAAELNGCPGPRHVLDLAQRLGLTADQRARPAIVDDMKAEAIPLGRKIIVAERDLNAAFAARTVTRGRLQAATAAISRLQGELRDTHLKYHLETAALLTADQIHRYAQLRGYAVGAKSTGPEAPQDGQAGMLHRHMMGAMPSGE